ncbi:MAG: hypothetical protein ACYDEN_08160 [Acidimicrobiales bacterium]
MLSRLASHLTAVLTDLRWTGYAAQIVLVGYYSLDYANALDNELSAALDPTMHRVGSAFGAEYADGFDAWRAAARCSGGDPCRAGLLTQLYHDRRPTGTCGIHPSPAGAAVLAGAVESAVIK